MSEIRVTSVVGENGGDPVGLTTGLTVGPLTGTTGVGATITHQGHAQFAGVCTATNVSAASSVTATTFYGSGANLTGLSSGLSFVQQWRLTSNKSTSSTSSDISANLEVVDSDGYGGLGGTMTQSSGVFTFPSTGIYLIMAKGSYSASSQSTSNYNEMDLHTTTDGASFNRAAIGWCHIGSGGYGTAACDFVFNVTNTSTHKVKFRGASASSNAYLTANTNDNQTHFTFIKLG